MYTELHSKAYAPTAYFISLCEDAGQIRHEHEHEHEYEPTPLREWQQI